MSLYLFQCPCYPARGGIFTKELMRKWSKRYLMDSFFSQMGETIEIRGEGKTAYFVTVSILDVTEAGDTTTYVIKTYATSNLAGNEHKRFITIVEAENGVSYNAFEFINEETISIKLVRNEKIGAVILGSPDWPGLSYRIVVEK